MKPDSIYFQLILKELDTIQDIIKNLDSLIQNSKNFALAFWGGGLYLIVQHLEVDKAVRGWLILLTAIIPILFWVMDFKWRKHVLQCSIRMRNISQFINSQNFSELANQDNFDNAKLKFPLYDPLSWFFLKSKNGKLKIHETEIEEGNYDYSLDSEYFRDESEPTFERILFYKEATFFFLTMIIISVILGIVFLKYSSENSIYL